MKIKDWNNDKIIDVTLKNGKYYYKGKPIKFIGSPSKDYVVTAKRIKEGQQLTNDLINDVNELAKLHNQDPIMSSDSAYATGKSVIVKASGKPSTDGWDNVTYTFNGLPPSNGYRYFDKGNVYTFRDGKRYLVTNTKPNQKTSWNITKQIDNTIGQIPNYGWIYNDKTNNNYWTRSRLLRTINPSARWDASGAATEGWNYMWNIPLEARDHYVENPHSHALWARHLGYPRDYTELPANGIRFNGDYNGNNLKYPSKEYTGIPSKAKDAIKYYIKEGKVNPNPDGSWTPVKESAFLNHKDLEQYANFSIRNNNNSDIYDMFDTYDFPEHFWTPKLNRTKDKQIEIRDTIWGPNANPKLYNPRQ